MRMSLLIPNEVLQAARMTEGEMRQELAVLLFQREKLTLGQAADLAQMNVLQFQQLLAARQVPLHYDITDFEQALQTLREMRKS
jgi:predicted HTH domain antitoxin